MNLKLAINNQLGTINITPQGGVKQIRLLNNEGEQMEIEEDGIKGVVNLGLKKKLEKSVINLAKYYSYLSCLGMEERSTITLETGFAHLELFKQEGSAPASADSCFQEADVKDAIEKISLGFQKAETKKKISWEKKQKILKARQEREAKLAATATGEVKKEELWRH